MDEELKGLFTPLPEVSRRSFVVTSLTAGFAFAVEPIQEPTTITTSTGHETRAGPVARRRMLTTRM